jgi:hypothetical protein
LGIRALRSIAVDYSGASGAPALIVVVDRVTGAAGREVREQLNLGREKTVSLADRGFRCVVNGRGAKEGMAQHVSPGSMFVWPKAVKLRFDANRRGRESDGGVLEARGGTEYFLVMTLQRGPAPK